MKTKKASLTPSILWFVSAGLWSVMLVAGLMIDSGSTNWVRLVVSGLCLAGSLIAAIDNLIKYNKTKE